MLCTCLSSTASLVQTWMRPTCLSFFIGARFCANTGWDAWGTITERTTFICLHPASDDWSLSLQQQVHFSLSQLSWWLSLIADVEKNALKCIFFLPIRLYNSYTIHLRCGRMFNRSFYLQENISRRPIQIHVELNGQICYRATTRITVCYLWLWTGQKRTKLYAQPEWNLQKYNEC